MGANVRRARWAAGLTQEEAAAASGVDLRHYQDIETGRVDPKLSTLRTLAQNLRVTIGAFVDLDPAATARARERMANATPPPTGRRPRDGRTRAPRPSGRRRRGQ